MIKTIAVKKNPGIDPTLSYATPPYLDGFNFSSTGFENRSAFFNMLRKDIYLVILFYL
jgi:hypothetical protein